MPRWALELLMAPFAVPKIRDRPCCDVDWNPPRRAGARQGRHSQLGGAPLRKKGEYRRYKAVVRPSDTKRRTSRTATGPGTCLRPSVYDGSGVQLGFVTRQSKPD